MGPVALTLGVLDVSHSAADLGLVLGSYSVTFLLFVLPGGVWADRLPRHRLMLAMNIVQFLAQGSLGLLLLSNHPPLWALMALSAVNGTANAFYQPASTGLTSALVQPEHLQRANALLSFTFSSASVGGPLVASALAATVGAGWALSVCAFAFLGSAYFLSGVRLLAEPPNAQRSHFLGELKQGFTEVTRRSWLWVTLVGFGTYHLVFGTFLVLGPTELAGRQHGFLGWGAVVGALGAGSLIGDALAMWLHPRRILLVARLVELLSVPMLLVVAWSAPLPILIVGAVLGGIAVSFPDALWHTALQQHVPKDLISRVSSLDWMVSLALRPLAFGSAAYLGKTFGTPTTLVTGAVLLVVTVAVATVVRDVRTLERVGPAEADERAGGGVTYG